MSKLSSTDLLKAATSQTGLSNFGGGQFRHDYELFISSLDMDHVPLERQTACREYIIHLLVNRLRFEHDWAEHPEISREMLLPPVAIVSLPRAGTTKLQRILCATNSFQNLQYWQAHSFARIPEERDDGKAARLQQATEFLAWLTQILPGIMQTHPMAPEDVEEEYFMMQASFHSIFLSSIFPAPGYSAWLATSSMDPAYDYLVRQLQYMQWQFGLNGEGPKPWLLKSPGMFGHEDQLTRIFPQGLKIISTHRAPKDVIPSTARTGQFAHYFGHKLDSKDMGTSMLEWFSSSMRRYIDWRKNNKTVQVLDLGFQEITNDSLGTAKKVCDFLDIPLTTAAISNIQQWDIDNPRNKHGINAVSLEEYGLDSAQINSAFESYIDEFSVYF